MIEDILFYTKLALYGWAIAELGILVTLYFYAYTEMKQSRVIKYLSLFLLSVFIELCYRFALNYTVKITTEFHDIMRDILIIPLAMLILTTRSFRKASTDKVLKSLED